MSQPKRLTRAYIGCLALFVGTILLYAPTFHFGFINLDDTAYVQNNFHINGGLSWEGLKWCFQAGYAGNWHPLTWLSLMLDCQFFGVRPGADHAINVLLHATNSILLFLVLQELTGAFWRSLITAALFAWHPLHVESVTWIAERKDVLCTLFWMLTLWAYVRYVGTLKERADGERGVVGTARRAVLGWFTRERSPRRGDPTLPTTMAAGRATLQRSRSWLLYTLTLFFFVLALMSKPMAVTLPFVLLLLDWWPLGRVSPGSASEAISLFREKIPFFVLSAVCSVLTVIAQRGSAIASLSDLPLKYRLPNVAVSYWRYLEKIFWPTRLSIIYPFHAQWPIAQVVLAVVVLFGISALLIFARPFGRGERLRVPDYLPVGWLWFLGTLVPVIGLVQVGAQAMADRYSYIPSIGIFIIIAWGTYDLVKHLPFHRLALGCAGGLVLVGCLAASARQIQFWQNSGTLFAHAVAVTPGNFMARVNYADYLADSHDYPAAENQAAAAVRIAPQESLPHSSLGRVLSEERKFEQAIDQLRQALKIQYTPSDAIRLATVYSQTGRMADAIAQYQDVLRRNGSLPDALNNLAWIRAASAKSEFRNGPQAVELAERACALTHFSQPLMIGTLAAAYAEAGRFKEAVATAQRAHDVAAAQGDQKVAERNLELKEVYRSGRAYHEGS